MTPREFLKERLADVEYQLNAVFANFPDGKWDEKVNEHAMSASETAAHLSECYTAFLTNAEGNEYSWGTFKPASMEPTKLVKSMFELREKACTMAVATDDPKIHKLAASFITLHDAYHVGQMVTLRLTIGEFDPYSIYNH